MGKLHFWDGHKSWEDAERAWDEGEKKAKEAHPLKVLKTLPSMPGISDETAKGLKWKSLKWMIQKDEGMRVFRHIIKNPFVHAFRYLCSLFKKKPYLRDGDFFYYNVENLEQFKKLLADDNTLFVIGFSYCEKPHECPSGRFTDLCIADPENSVCRQCFIGKCVNSLPQNRCKALFIPTIHYIGEQMFEIKAQNKGKKIVFLITACELTLEMFGDFGNMAALQGIGVRLDGRICNTMKAFQLSEQGIKPGLTVVTKPTEKRILDLLAYFRSCS